MKNSITTRSKIFSLTGVAMTAATIGLIVAGNSDAIYPLEHARFPVSWIAAGVALLAFVAAEFWSGLPGQAERSSPPEPVVCELAEG